jgi:hypothetical protein
MLKNQQSTAWRLQQWQLGTVLIDHYTAEIGDTVVPKFTDISYPWTTIFACNLLATDTNFVFGD